VPRLARPHFEGVPMVFRTYRISAGAQPIMMVSEFFGSSLFKELH
jgi:chorismate-pyruvate lyase